MGATYPAGITTNYGEQLSLTTALASLGMPGIETKQALLYCDGDFRLHINPAILEIYFYDNSQTGVAKWVNLKQPGRDLTDRTTTGSGTVLDTLTVDDRLLICFSDLVAGFRVVMTASVNAEASRVMVCEYPVVAAWTGLTETDGTIVATAKSLGQTGSVTFTAVTDWASNHFGSALHIYGTHLAIDDVDTGLDTAEELDATETDITMDADPSSAIVAGDYIIIDTEVMYVNSSSATNTLLIVTRGVLGSTAATHSTNADTFIYRFDCPSSTRGFWLKTNWTGGDLGADVEIQDLWALNKNTNRMFLHAGVEYPISFDRRVTGAIEALHATATATLDVNWIRTVV
ncbi:hypothetical protein LCGC14_1290910 [marine sediment metagenome]|uniref:Uncharacterized protein n=1 Tax=marine sediment metagenome TaxID=412755 RepID=A0A0F9KU70_9ZZZZ